MRKILAPAVALCLALPALASASADWPQWRGPDGTGTSPDATPPIRFSETENVRWKVAIPGRGHASPIVWGDHVYLLTAETVPGVEPAAPALPPDADQRSRRRAQQAVHPVAQRYLVLALSRRDGSVAWQRVAGEAVPAGTTHRDATWASASPVTDGQAVYASFGSQGLYAYRLDGTLLWHKDLGDMRTRNGFGEGSSPALWGDKLIVNWDHEDDSFIVVLDKTSGQEVWRQARDEVTSWSTPLVAEVGGKPQVIVAATGKSRGYDLASGEVIWQLGGMTVNVVPSPVVGHGLAFLMSGFRGSAVQAVRLAAARGELEGSAAVAWSGDRDTPYVPSPLLYGDQLYFLKVNTGILSCLDAATGEAVWPSQRLDGISNVYASPVGADGRVYLAGREGTVLVLAHGDQYRVLAANSLDQGFDASPALAGDALFLRGSEHLYCLAAAPGAGEAAADSGR